MEEQKKFKAFYPLRCMKEELGWTALILLIITIIFWISAFVLGRGLFEISDTVALNVGISFWYFLVFTIIIGIFWLRAEKDKHKRRKRR